MVRYLYHVTYLGDLQSIADTGLSAGGGQTFTTMENYSVGRLFLTEEDGISFWNSRYADWAEHRSDNPVEDRFIPVTLRATEDEVLSELQLDEVGTKDALYDSYFVEDGYISPDQLEVYNGKTWISLQSVDPDGMFEEAVQAADIEEVDGETLVLPDFDVFHPTANVLDKYLVRREEALERVRETIHLGMEYVSGGGGLYGAFLEEMSGSTPYRVQWYDVRGLSGHSEVANEEDAVELLVSDLGYDITTAEGSMNKLFTGWPSKIQQTARKLGLNL